MNWTTPQTDYTPKRPLFLCVLSTTDTAKIPGISAAGKTPEMTEYTPAGDAELVLLGKPKCTNEPPMTPSGAPTPAVITRASMQLTGTPCMFIDAGLKIKPDIPLLNVGATHAKDIRTGHSVTNPQGIFERAFLLGQQLRKTHDFIIIGESVPGGTTTALGILEALGYNSKVSSSFSENPSNIKQQAVKEAMEKNNINFGQLKHDPFKAIELLGDPMMPAVTGLAKGLDGVNTVLAGGTQMISVLALIKHMNIKGNISIATTKFVAEDKTASFSETANTLGYKAYTSDPGFKKARFEGLKMYEKGDVKEGVGAGGAMLLANIMGIKQKDFRDEVDNICTDLFK